jgi:hypothetical protein
VRHFIFPSARCIKKKLWVEPASLYRPQVSWKKESHAKKMIEFAAAFECKT